MERLLEVKDLSISFGGIKAVQDLNFHIDKGEVLALIGPNGSGKSTTVNMISGVYIQNKGTITFDGKEIPTKMSIADRAKLGIARTFQTPKPFAHLNVFDNIYTIALQQNSKAQAVELTNEILNLTKLYDLKDTKSAKLSIEKRKWMDLARCMATKPKIIMMDEVMAGIRFTSQICSYYLRIIKNSSRFSFTEQFSLIQNDSSCADRNYGFHYVFNKQDSNSFFIDRTNQVKTGFHF